MMDGILMGNVQSIIFVINNKTKLITGLVCDKIML